MMDEARRKQQHLTALRSRLEGPVRQVAGAVRSWGLACSEFPGWTYYERRQELEMQLHNMLDNETLENSVRLARLLLNTTKRF
jgi:hypothetical protein